MSEKRPILGISMGDPSGIGPEVAVKALAKKEIYEEARPLMVGDSGVIRMAIKITGVECFKENEKYGIYAEIYDTLRNISS